MILCLLVSTRIAFKSTFKSEDEDTWNKMRVQQTTVIVHRMNSFTLKTNKAAIGFRSMRCRQTYNVTGTEMEQLCPP